MKKTALALACVFVSVTLVDAGIPVQDMTLKTLGVTYDFHWTGQMITDANVGSRLSTHAVLLSYSPVRFVLVSMGLGWSQFSVDEYQDTEFSGAYLASFSGHGKLFTPFIGDFLRFTGGMESVYFKNDDEGYEYQGWLLNPMVGVILSPARFVDIELGFKGQIIAGSMNSPTGASGADFSNGEIPRGYGELLLHEPASGAHLALSFEAGPKIGEKDWSGGPFEAAIGASVGFMLRHMRPLAKSKDRGNQYFPESDYEKMKKQQDEMLDDIAE